jgi:hypothetical protein
MVIPPSANAKNRGKANQPVAAAPNSNNSNANAHYFNVRGDSQLLKNKNKLPANHLMPIQTPETGMLPGSR